MQTQIRQRLLFLAITIKLLFFPINSSSQQVYCLFDSLNPPHRLVAAEMQIRKGVEKILTGQSERETTEGFRMIPVVVHVIHNGGSENISSAQIESQIRILNEDFGKLPGTPGDGNGEDTEVRFCLAKKNPQGRCSDGVVRLRSTLTNHKPVDRAMLKQLSFWDNTRYLNIYIVKSITGNVGGYSSFPYTPPDVEAVPVSPNKLERTTIPSSSGGV